jgi:V/A-type H+/Na+-transporting ATPase subunit C
MLGGGVSTYASIQAKVRVMYSNLLSPQEMIGLYEAPDFNALISQLKQTGYGPYLNRVKEKDLSPRRVAFQLRTRLADSYLSIIRTLPYYIRPLLVQFYRSFEVDNLKAVMRGIVNGASWDRVRFFLFPYGPSTVLPAQAMVDSGNIAAAVEMLHGTPYAETLSFAMKRYAAEQNLFTLEVALDLSYWRGLWKFINILPGDDKTQAKRIIGSLVDITNLMWAIRYRVYHHLSEEELINYTLSFGFRVKDDDIRAIAAGADIVKIVQRIYPGIANVEELLQAPYKGLPTLELELQRYEMERCKAAFIGNPFHIGVPLAYLVLSKMEIQDLIVLLEAKSSEVPPDNIRQYLLSGGAAPK